MKLPLFLYLLLVPVTRASIGDNLAEFTSCVSDCDVTTCSTTSPSLKYSKNTINPISAVVFWWDCRSDCHYKCQQIVTQKRKKSKLNMVQFYGKWPFSRVFGITELFSTVFSMANFYVNYVNFFKIQRHYRANAKAHPEKASMLFQYIILLVISMTGWTFSSIFHIRDTPLTETLDYVGASTISVANFNTIFIRYFGLHQEKRKRAKTLFQTVLFIVLMGHCYKLYAHWDYSYNMKFNVVFGLSAAFLWISHSLKVNTKYNEKAHIYSNSIYLLPHETRLLAKLNYVGLSRTKYIPLIPVALNVFLLSTVLLEMTDFEPWFQLIDAHSLWHLCTVFPPIIWYDWNVWDLELAAKIGNLA